MSDPLTKRGVLNDFDLARWSDLNRTASAKDNTGTLPFLALDLLNEKTLNGSVRRLYRHDAESFTWCLLYICICMVEDKEEDDQIGTLDPHPLSSWFLDMGNCAWSKTTLFQQELLKNFPLHHKIQLLAEDLYNCWISRYYKQSEVQRSRGRVGLYEELPDQEWFKQVSRLHLDAKDSIPESMIGIFDGISKLVTALYPFVGPSKSIADAS